MSLVRRIRRLPGFTAAAVAFCLIVLMGVGGITANALWGQSATVQMNVTAMSACTNVPTSGGQGVKVSWTVPTGHPGTPYNVTLVLQNPGNKTESIILPDAPAQAGQVVSYVVDPSVLGKKEHSHWAASVRVSFPGQTDQEFRLSLLTGPSLSCA